ncbi:NADP transhydrogenase subunit alpha [Anoxybacter fermentans]|uniref:NADP transhydrogenase subunit alpha n=1 Tax=Anoxybacter fermentans TaxID=1323375 RepID=A0A3Q9HRN0_9FIRM|nr:NAD/NADP-dependent octopine/nopaline dehydrogenase family protein [Anoxybacter fermentans]AZR72986.1 NADP transhydrogenase subunit alpha [Anoxybacter fermentans]
MFFERKPKFAVLGAGHGGQAMAAHLALMGYEVNLFNKTATRIEAVRKIGGIHLSGVFNGFGKLKKVTTDLRQAIAGVDIIMIVTPATAHEFFARALVPVLEDGQIVVLNPGRTGGALEFAQILKEEGFKKKCYIAETQTFLYASRVIGPAQARIFGLKNIVPIAAFPAVDTPVVYNKLHRVFPQFTPAKNILKTSLENIGAVFHPVPTILNVGRIESTRGDFTYYHEGISPSVARFAQMVDDERMAVALRLGVDVLTARDWMRKVYGVQGNTLYEVFQNNRQYDGIKAPATIDHRYIYEDVPMSLVPISSLGRMLGVPTPAINTIIDMACLLHERDYWAIGRTVEKLGLAGMTVKEIQSYVETGKVKVRRPSKVSRFTVGSEVERVVDLGHIIREREGGVDN